MEATMQGFYVNLPNTEVKFFKDLIKKMGWTITNAPMENVKLEGVVNAEIPSDILSLVGIASSISDEDIENDDRLSYLLGK